MCLVNLETTPHVPAENLIILLLRFSFLLISSHLICHARSRSWRGQRLSSPVYLYLHPKLRRWNDATHIQTFLYVNRMRWMRDEKWSHNIYRQHNSCIDDAKRTKNTYEWVDLDQTRRQCANWNVFTNSAMQTHCGAIMHGLDWTQVGIITYDSRSVYFSTNKNGARVPQMSLVTDLDDIFVPQPEEIFVNLDDCRSAVASFFNTLPRAFWEFLTKAAATSSSCAPPASLLATIHWGGTNCDLRHWRENF